jgi:uncharacterized protein YndB with AHSA1/START domain
MQQKAPAARIELLIHCPIDTAFAAFVEPEVLCKFWLESASEPLRPGGRTRWTFLVPGAAAELRVLQWDPPTRILTAWDDGTTVEWSFAAHSGGGTVITINQTGFAGEGPDAVTSALDATQGFTLVLCELKALLEGGVSLHAVRDKAALIEASRK